MKKIWVKSIPWNKKIITTALESGADAVVVPHSYHDKVKKLGVIKTISEDGDLKLGKDVIEWEIKGKQDEDEIIKLSKEKIVIVKTSDWTIIPLENLVAQTNNLIAQVKSKKEAQTMLKVLEKGVDGVLLDSDDINVIKSTIAEIKEIREECKLIPAKIVNIETLGMGDRVCVDTCTNMKLGQGMLVGNSSNSLFLVHAENVENPYVEQRPFRVNAGPVHAYTRVGGGKTKYLSELKSGDEVILVDFQGKTENAIVGRAKVEKRPLLLVEAEWEGKKISTILQNAETIRLTTPKGEPISVIELKPGVEVLATVEDAGRHFGIKIEETIIEK
jgi:3-dehydroquinate synthase II